MCKFAGASTQNLSEGAKGQNLGEKMAKGQILINNGAKKGNYSQDWVIVAWRMPAPWRRGP